MSQVFEMPWLGVNKIVIFHTLRKLRLSLLNNSSLILETKRKKLIDFQHGEILQIKTPKKVANRRLKKK